MGACICQVHLFSVSEDTIASITYTKEPIHKNAQHCHNRCTKNKLKKQHRLLSEVIVLRSIKPNLFSANDIDNDIIVVDGGGYSNPYMAS